MSKQDEDHALSDDDLYDDCEVCQAVKKATKSGKVLSESELLAAFRRAKKAGAMVSIPGEARAAPVASTHRKQTSGQADRKELRLSLTQDELHALIELVSLGEYVVNADALPDEWSVPHMAVEEAVLKQVYWLGMTDEVERTSDDQYEITTEFEDHIDETWRIPYEDRLFWQELHERLATRDITSEFGDLQKRTAPSPKELDHLRAVWDRYETEFDQHGLDRLHIQSPSNDQLKKPKRKK